MTQRLAAEFVGTLWLGLCGCGAAVLAFPNLGIGFTGVALAFGLTCSSCGCSGPPRSSGP
jgi:aquaporin Z